MHGCHNWGTTFIPAFLKDYAREIQLQTLHSSSNSLGQYLNPLLTILHLKTILSRQAHQVNSIQLFTICQRLGYYCDWVFVPCTCTYDFYADYFGLMWVYQFHQSLNFHYHSVYKRMKCSLFRIYTDVQIPYFFGEILYC